MMDVLLIHSFIKLSVASRAVIHGFPRESLSSMCGCISSLYWPFAILFSPVFPAASAHKVDPDAAFALLYILSRHHALLFRLCVELSKPTILCCNPRHGLDIPLTPDLSKICAAQMNTLIYSSAKKRENCRYNLVLIHLRSITLENLRQNNTEFTVWFTLARQDSAFALNAKLVWYFPVNNTQNIISDSYST